MSIESKQVYATLPKTVRGQPIVLGPDPKGKNILYANGNSIVIRDVANPAFSDVYTQHAKPTTVAKYSPSGFYIASGDVSGKLRIWDTTQAEHLLKYEYQPLSGAIKDLAWSEDSKRIVVAGDGRDKFASVFLWDSGSSVGTVAAHSKSVNSVDYKPNRPYRIVTSSEDQTAAFFEGPPFKYIKTIRDHTNFVNATRFSPNGEVFCTAGADGKVLMFDGKTGDMTIEVGSPAHKGGVYAVCFSPDSSQLMTCSADKTVKTWDVVSGQLVTEFTMGTTIDDMQVGCLWQADSMISVSLSGFINYLDKANPSSPAKVIKGHTKSIISSAMGSDQFVYTSSWDNKIMRWSRDGECEEITGPRHASQVTAVSWADDTLTSIGVDDTLRFACTTAMEHGADTVSMPSLAKAVCSAPGKFAIAACTQHLVLVRDGKKVFTADAPFQPTSVAVHQDMVTVAVGGATSKAVHMYTLSGDTLSEKNLLKLESEAVCVSFSPDGMWLAVGEANRKVTVFPLPDCETKTEFVGHSAKVNCLAWSPDSTHLCSGGLDTNIMLYEIGKLTKKATYKSAHPMSSITGLHWRDERTLVSVGSDACVRIWNVTC